MRIAISLFGLGFIFFTFFYQTIFQSNLAFADNLEWTICYTLGAVTSWLGISDAGKWKSARIYLALGISANGLGQYIWNVQLYLNDIHFPGISDIFFFSTGVFLLASAIRSATTIQFNESPITLFLDSFSISILVTIVILSIYIPHQGDFTYLQLVAIVIYPLSIFSATSIFIILYLSNGNDYSHSRIIFLIGCLALGICWLEWNDRFLKNHLEDASLLNHIFSVAIIMLGYGGSKWSLKENLDSHNISFSLRFLPVIKVSIASILFFYIWKNQEASLSMKVIAAIGTVVVLIFASIRQMVLIQEKVVAESELKAANYKLKRIIASRTKELKKSNASLTETQSQLLLSEKLASLGQLMGSIAHEINTPLSAILSSNGTVKLLLFENLESTLRYFRGITEKEAECWLDLFRGSLRVRFNFDLKANKSKVEEMTSLFVKMDLDHQSIAKMLVEFGYDNTSVPKSLFDLDRSKLTEIVESVKFFTDIIRACEIIQESTSRSSKVIKSLKSYLHQVDSTSLEEINLNEQIESLLFLYFTKFQEEVKFTYEISKEIFIECYADDLSHVWINLINNSLQAMDYKGEIAISATTNDKSIEVLIRDNGPGIPDDLSSKIFEAFFTTKKIGEGTGLGLAIVKSIVERHNGIITYDSTHMGTTFKVTLPRCQ